MTNSTFDFVLLLLSRKLGNIGNIHISFQNWMLICYASFWLSSDIHTSKTHARLSATQKILIHTDSTCFLHQSSNSPKWCLKVFVPASSKWPFDIPNGGHLTPEKVTWNTQKGHSEEPGCCFFLFFLRMRCVIFFDTLPKGFGDSFVAPHLLPGTNCIMNPERMPVSAPSNECPRCVESGWR